MDLTKNKFNLIDEHWIPVETESDPNVLLSLREVFEKAHSIRRIASETAPLDAAILRMLLALVHRQMSNYSAQGELVPLISPREALLRFDEFWEQGYFNMEIFNPYFEDHYDDFWLFGENKSFGQTAVAKNGTEYTPAKLIPDLSQSSNKTRIFSRRGSEGITKLPFDEAARYLLFVNFYDDTSAKPKGKNLPSVGAGLGGKIGQIYAEGNNLFETLLLNCVLVKPDDSLWPQDLFSWEKDPSSWQQRLKIPTPNDFGSYMTLRSRLLNLNEKDDYITDYTLLGGDFFDLPDCDEPFTLWRKVKVKKGEQTSFAPKRHSVGRQLWRDFSLITTSSDEVRQPMLLHWITRLETEELLPDNQPIFFNFPSITYGDKDFMITDSSSQSLSFFPKLLTKAGGDFRMLVEEEIKKISDAAYAVGCLYRNVAEIQRLSEDATKKQLADGQAQVYEAMDGPFKNWLVNVGSDAYSIRELRQNWEETALKIDEEMIKSKMIQVLEQSQTNALLGRVLKDENSGTPKNVLSVFDAERICRATIHKIYDSKV